jgi:uncharacterized protein YecT (DUF1311 family)
MDGDCVLRIFLAALCLGLCGTVVLGAESCDQPVTQYEMNDCAAVMWQAADGELNASYKAAMSYLKTLDADLPQDFRGGAKALLAAQRAWIVYRDAACEAESAVHAGGSIRPLIMLTCMERLTRVRDADLRLIWAQN